MKQQKFMTRIIFALALATMIAVPTASLRAQSSDEPTTARAAAAGGGLIDVLEQIKLAQAQALEGTWILSVSPVVPPGTPPPPPFTVYATFSRGGTYIGSDRSRPLDGPQHGVWQHLGGNQVAWSIIQDRFDALGNYLGTFTARSNATLTGPDNLVVVSSVEFRDAAGNLVLARCATGRAERFKLLPLGSQCQSITPPQ